MNRTDQAATARIDLPAASTTEVIGAILEALARIEVERHQCQRSLG